MHNFLFTLPSHGRISDEQMDILKILLKSGADPTVVQESTGLTPIHFAVQRDKAVLNCLLQSTNESNQLLSININAAMIYRTAAGCARSRRSKSIVECVD